MTNNQKLKNYFLLPNLFLLGFVALVAQTIFFREAIIFVSGNELVFGAIASVWLLAGAFGSYLSSKVFQKEFFLKVIHGALIILIPASLLILRFVGPLIVPLGESANFFEVFLISFFSLFPLNFFLTAEFLTCLNLLSAELKEGPGFSYFLESFGAFVGAAVFTFFLSGNLISWQAITVLSFLMAIVSFFLYWRWEKFLSITFLLFLLIFFPFLPQTESLTRSFWFSNLSLDVLFSDLAQVFSLPEKSGLILSQDSKFQNISLTRRVNQLNLFLNGQPSGFIGENPMIQEVAHTTLALKETPETVLVIGLSTGQLIKEVLKHPVKKVVLVELDPDLLKILKKNLPPKEVLFLEDRRLEVFYGDVRHFLKENREKFDIAIFNFPDPRSTILARLYTVEFLRMIKKGLTPSGILSFVISTTPEYLSPTFFEYNGSMVSTVKKVFPFVKAVPSFGAHILASSNKINLSSRLILRRLKERKIKSSIDPVYLKHRIERSSYFTEIFKKKFEINTDNRPISVFLTSLIWQNIEGRQSVFQGFQLFLYRYPYSLSCLLVFLPFVFLFFKKHTGLSIMFSVSLAGMVGEMCLIYIYQLVSGYIYSHLGLLLAFFMFGLSIGSFVFRTKDKGLEPVALALLLLLLFLPYAKNISLASFTLPFYLFMIGLLGFFVGSAFPLTVAKFGIEQSNLVYSIDLLGGAVGAFISGALMLPLLGLTGSCFSAAAVVFFSILLQKLGQ